jgi:cellobiose-specific phosphotransferase system component IIC
VGIIRGETAGTLELAGLAETAVPSASSAWSARLVGFLSLVAVVVFGEAALVAVVGVGRHLAHGANAGAWAIATSVNATIAYVLVGLPQLKAWDHAGAGNVDQEPNADPRARFATRTLSGGGLAAFVVASVVGGPLAVGWFYGRRRDPRARSLTWAAAWLLAAVWSAVYLGLVARVF